MFHWRWSEGQLPYPSKGLRDREITYPDLSDHMGNMEIKEQNSMNNQDVALGEASETLKELIRDQARKTLWAME